MDWWKVMNKPDDDHALPEFAAILDARALADSKKPGTVSTGVTAMRLVAYALRDDSVADMAIERTLRENQQARILYRNAMARRSADMSQLAAAASDARSTVRFVGNCKVECVEDTGSAFLIVHLPVETVPPRFLEVRDTAGYGHRLELPDPVQGIVQLTIDPRNDTLVAAYDLMQRPDSALYLIS